MSETLSLSSNLALMAGAGAGKTHSLVTLCLHLLSGARSGAAPLKPAALCLLTFTDKAAAEMRSRLRDRLDRLAVPAPLAQLEPELAASFQRCDTPPPPPRVWRYLRDELASASIGTFHSLCVRLLRHAPAGLGVDPAFTLLEEREAASVLEDVAQRLVLERVEAQDPAVVELCRELGFSSRGRALGLVQYLCGTFNKLREEGLEASGLRIGSGEEARQEFEAALGAVRRAAARAHALVEATSAYAPLVDHCHRAAAALTYDTFPTGHLGLAKALREGPALPRRAGELTDALKALKHGVLGTGGEPSLRDYFAACRAVPLEAALRGLLGELKVRHSRELRKRGALDFAQLLLCARDLLRDDLAFRREVQERIGALLLDEFQDTNRVQLELVMLLAEAREGGPRAVTSGAEVLGLPLEPAFLCAVGDRKQSIYEFRGADVSVFGTLAQSLEAQGGQRAYLQANRRSSPALLSFFNGLFAALMPPKEGARDYEVVYAPGGDDLTAVRPAPFEGRAVERLVFEAKESAEACRQQEAEALARRLRALLDGGERKVVGKQGQLRAPVGGDVAVLFRRFSHLEVYRQAMTRAGIPHRVVRGRGFYGAQEVLDLASMLMLVADPSDGIALLAVLRSPLVALADSSLVRLGLAAGRRLTVKVLEELAPVHLAGVERASVERLVSLFHRLRRERDRLGLRLLLAVALEETEYRAAVAGTPYGEQALANLDKLLGLAEQADAAGRKGCAAFARELLALADAEPTEAQADVLEAGDSAAVNLLTIHQAKGLEWPIVVVPDLAAQLASRGDRVAFDRGLGLAVKPWIPDDPASCSSPRFRAVMAELRRREQAEHVRLLYVAVTRARDYLVLSGQAPRMAGSWRAMVDAALANAPELGARVLDVHLEALPPPAAATEPPAQVTPRELVRVDQVLARVRQAPAVSPASVVFAVTQLQDYFRCPRRYLYAHQVGLAEFPVVLQVDEVGAEELGARSAVDPRLRGSLAHRLLERIELRLISRGPSAVRRALEELLWAEGMDPTGRDGAEIVGWAAAFLGTPFAATLAEEGARVRREVPFLLRLGGGQPLAVHLKGQIDLLVERADGQTWVLDYKSSEPHPRGLDPYAFQLDCYALAAARLTSGAKLARTGVVFLQEKRPSPHLRATSAEDLAAFEGRLVAAAGSLLEANRRQEWPGLEVGACEALRCGYQARCHPGLAPGPVSGRR